MAHLVSIGGTLCVGKVQHAELLITAKHPSLQRAFRIRRPKAILKRERKETRGASFSFPMRHSQ